MTALSRVTWALVLAAAVLCAAAFAGAALIHALVDLAGAGWDAV